MRFDADDDDDDDDDDGVMMMVVTRVRSTQWVKSLCHCCKQHLQAEECRSVGQEAQS